jgi:hypothetical protein
MATPQTPPAASSSRSTGMIRTWYRSRLFWLGIPGLLFLIWGWRQSNLRSVEIYWGARLDLFLAWGAGVA